MRLPKVPDRFDKASQEPPEGSGAEIALKTVKRDASDFDYVMNEKGNVSSFFAMTENMVLDAEECR